MTSPQSLIINSAFEEPGQHWQENSDRTLRVESRRRPAGYEITRHAREHAPFRAAAARWTIFAERVRQWREAGVARRDRADARTAAAVGGMPTAFQSVITAFTSASLRRPRR